MTVAELCATYTSSSEERVMVGIGEYRVGRVPMTTIGLGSCIALVLHDTPASIGGMAHIMLPSSNGRGDRPGKYADTAIEILKQELTLKGSRSSRLVAKMVGGASMFRDFSGNLNIGERNIEAVRFLVKRNGLAIAGQDVGGVIGRTLTYYPEEEGRIVIRRADGTGMEM